jgi:hypothetical protein
VTLVDVHLGSENASTSPSCFTDPAVAPSPVILISTHAEQDFVDMIEASPVIGFLAKIVLTPNAIRDLVDGAAPREKCDQH